MKLLTKILLNCVYYGAIGVFVTWAFKLNIYDGMYWVQLLIFSLLINVHRDIDNKINPNS